MKTKEVGHVLGIVISCGLVQSFGKRGRSSSKEVTDPKKNDARGRSVAGDERAIPH